MKAIRTVLPSPPAHWVGNGFHVYPVFSHLAFTKEISPFLMLDYGAPKHFEPTSKRRGVGKHPHRGFETVTLAYHGEVEHQDSVGNKGVIKEGDVQWMTAAGGIIHEEFHSTEFSKRGGLMEMVQLWVNLPKKHKMDPPSYQPIFSKDIPRVPISPDQPELGSVRIVAGSYNGTKGPARTHTPINVWDVDLNLKSASHTFSIEDGHNTIVFVRKGSVAIGGENQSLLKPQQVALLTEKGKQVTVTALEDDTKLLFLSGEPINEPIAARGPFVMNTEEEIYQANEDYHMGRFTR